MSYKTIISTKEMSHEEWLESRRIGIGGSDVAAILGLNNYKTPLQVWEEKTNPQAKEVEVNAKMRAGIMLEHVVAQWFSEDTGLKVQKDNKIRVHKDIPFFIANVDRIIVSENGSGPGVLEVKTTSGYIAKNWEAGEVPLHYYAQLQHYLNVTGYKYGYIAVLIDGWDFKSFRYDRDEEFIKIMDEKLIEFWMKVETKIKPEPESDEDIKLLFPKSYEGLTVDATDETYKHYQILTQVKQEIKKLESQEEALTQSLKLVMKDAESLYYNGQKIVTWKSTKDRVGFDKDSFKKDNPDLFLKYYTTTPGTRIFKIIQ